MFVSISLVSVYATELLLWTEGGYICFCNSINLISLKSFSYIIDIKSMQSVEWQLIAYSTDNTSVKSRISLEFDHVFKNEIIYV